MTTVTELNETAQRVLIECAEAASRTSGFTKRRSKVTGSLFVRTLVFGWLAHPQATLDELAQTACALGTPIRSQSLDERFTKDAAMFLQAVLKRAVHEKVEAEPVSLDLLARFNGVYLLDASQVTLPAELSEVWRGNGRKEPKAGTEAAVKLSVGFDLCQGKLLGPELTDGKEHDRNADLVARVLPKGSLRVADLGYFQIGELARLDRMGVFFLTRFQTKCGLYDAAGQARDLEAFLAAQGADVVRLDVPIQLGLAERLPCRLLAVRVPPAVAEGRRRRLRERAKARGGTPSQKARGGTPSQKARGGTPSQKARGGTPSQKARGGTPSQKARGGTPSQKARGGTPSQKARGGTPSQKARGGTPSQKARGGTPSQKARGGTPSQKARGGTPSQKARGGTPSQKARGGTPSQKARGGTPSQKARGGTPSQKARGGTPSQKARGGTPSQKELTLCDWTVLVTNVLPEMLSLEEALVLGRLRWQIELVFKLWKSHLLIDEWRTKKPWRILCEVYAKLLGALLQHWILVVTGWSQADRSLVKATRTLRSYIRSLALVLNEKEGWEAVMSVIRRCLDGRCRLEKRKTVPSSYQLLFNPQLLGLA